MNPADLALYEALEARVTALERAQAPLEITPTLCCREIILLWLGRYGELRIDSLIRAVQIRGVSASCITNAAWKLHRAGVIRRVDRGVYALAEAAA